MSYEAHPAADLFPMLDQDELRALADDIKANGLLEPIIIFEGKVLDGRNRAAACEIAQVPVRTHQMEFNGDEMTPTAWVLSKNLRRRQLTKSQAAMVAADALPMLEREARKRQGERRDLTQKVEESRNRNATMAASQAGELTGVNRQYVSDAKKIKEAAPEIADRVKAGAISLQEAKREIDKRHKAAELVISFEERKQRDEALQRGLDEQSKRAMATQFIRDLDVCVAAIFRSFPERESLLTNSTHNKELDRIAAELEQIARDVRAYKGESNGEDSHR